MLKVQRTHPIEWNMFNNSSSKHSKRKVGALSNWGNWNGINHDKIMHEDLALESITLHIQLELVQFYKIRNCNLQNDNKLNNFCASSLNLCVLCLHVKLRCQNVSIYVFTYGNLQICLCFSGSPYLCPLAWAMLSLHWAVKFLQYPLMVAATGSCERPSWVVTCM